MKLCQTVPYSLRISKHLFISRPRNTDPGTENDPVVPSFEVNVTPEYTFGPDTHTHTHTHTHTQTHSTTHSTQNTHTHTHTHKTLHTHTHTYTHTLTHTHTHNTPHTHTHTHTHTLGHFPPSGVQALRGLNTDLSANCIQGSWFRGQADDVTQKQ